MLCGEGARGGGTHTQKKKPTPKSKLLTADWCGTETMPRVLFYFTSYIENNEREGGGGGGYREGEGEEKKTQKSKNVPGTEVVILYSHKYIPTQIHTCTHIPYIHIIHT